MFQKAGEINPSLTKFLLTPLVWIVAIIFFIPIIWIVIGSIRPSQEIILTSQSVSWNTIIPSKVTLENYKDLLSGPFLNGIKNSFIVTFVAVIGGVGICAMAAFALSAIPWKARNLFFIFVVICFTVPVDSVAIPLSLIFKKTNLQNTYAALILPWFVDGMAIFLLRQFFLSIPKELVDSARVDGAGWWTIFLKIYIPLSKPALIGAGLMIFLVEWEAYLWPLLITTKDVMDVAPLAMVKVVLGRYYTSWGQMFAGAVLLASIPALILLPLQNYFTQSIKNTGLKE